MSPTLRAALLSLVSICVGGVTGCSKQIDEAVPAAKSPDAKAPVASKDKSEPEPPADKMPHHGVTFYSVDHYDEARDPAADLAMTVQRAGKENKRILVQVGGDWCIWCRRMTEFIETNETLRKSITDHFVVMKVTYTKDQPNAAFLSKYPKISGYPHLFVLDSDGKLLHSKDTDSLEKGGGYSEAAFLKFLADWQIQAPQK